MLTSGGVMRKFIAALIAVAGIGSLAAQQPGLKNHRAWGGRGLTPGGGFSLGRFKPKRTTPISPPIARTRKMISQRVLSFIAGLAVAAAACADYPEKPVRIVVGFTPGGGPDITARYLAQELGAMWKQQVIVENRPGAGGSVAAALVARAAPDGYTLLSVSSAHAAAPAIYSKLPYETKELTGITQTGSSKYVLVVAPSLGISSLKQLLHAASGKPGALNF